MSDDEVTQHEVFGADPLERVVDLEGLIPPGAGIPPYQHTAETFQANIEAAFNNGRAAGLRAGLERARAVITAGDELTLHMGECIRCGNRRANVLFHDDGACQRFTYLLNTEAEARALLAAPETEKP